MADKYLIGAPVQGQNKPTPLREGDNILNAHLLVGEAGQVAPNIYIVRDEKYVRYDTLTEAKNDAVAGETIVVARGTYNEQDLLKDQVNWHFEEGVVLQNDTTNPIFTDQNLGPITCNITGKVDIELTKEFEGHNLDLYKMFWVGVEESTINISLGYNVDSYNNEAVFLLNKGTYNIVANHHFKVFKTTNEIVTEGTGGDLTLDYEILDFIDQSKSFSDVFTTITNQGEVNIRLKLSGYITESILSIPPEVVGTVLIYDSKVVATGLDTLYNSSEQLQIRLVNTVFSKGIDSSTNPLLTNSIINFNNLTFGDEINPVSIEGVDHVILNRNITAQRIQEAYDSLTSYTRATVYVAPVTLNSIHTGYLTLDKNGGNKRTPRVLSSLGGDARCEIHALNIPGNYNKVIGFRTANLNIEGEGNVLENCILFNLSNTPTAEFRNCLFRGDLNTIDGAKLYNCTLENGEFPEPINGGALINCIDGNGNLITAFSDD